MPTRDWKGLEPHRVLMCLGRSASGKSMAINHLIRNYRNLFKGKGISKLLLVYSVYQPSVYGELIASLPEDTEVCLFHGLSESLFHPETLQSSDGTTVLILDDVLGSVLLKRRGEFHDQLLDLWTVGAHHFGVLVIVVAQTSTFHSPLSSCLLNNLSYALLAFYASQPSGQLCHTLQVYKSRPTHLRISTTLSKQ